MKPCNMRLLLFLVSLVCFLTPFFVRFVYGAVAFHTHETMLIEIMFAGMYLAFCELAVYVIIDKWKG